MHFGINIFKSFLLAFFSIPYFIAAYFMGSDVVALRQGGDVTTAGIIAALAVLLASIGLAGLAVSRRSDAAPDYLVALHSAISLLFVVISMQG